MHCEVCGKDTELFTAMVEGTQLHVCANCGRFGKILRRVPPPSAHKPAVQREPEPVERIVEDYAQRIRTAREKRNLSQQDFAKTLTIKESLLHKIETGTFEPPIDLARKLEHTLRIVLVQMREESTTMSTQKENKSDGLTIGDILKMKR